MKRIKYLIAIPILLLLFSACSKWDNYDAPDAGIFGAVTDAETGTSLELRSPGSGSIRFLEVNSKYPSIVPFDISLMADGKYQHRMLFSGTYKVWPWDGPFKYYGNSTVVQGDSVTIVVPPGQTIEQNFEVFPFFRIQASVVDSIFTYTITKSDSTTEKMVDIIFMVNNYPIVNEGVCANISGYYTNLWRTTIAASTPDNTILGIERTFTIPWIRTHLKKGDYYFRVGVRTSLARYNYSPVIMATVH